MSFQWTSQQGTPTASWAVSAVRIADKGKGKFSSDLYSLVCINAAAARNAPSSPPQMQGKLIKWNYAGTKDGQGWSTGGELSLEE